MMYDDDTNNHTYIFNFLRFFGLQKYICIDIPLTSFSYTFLNINSKRKLHETPWTQRISFSH